MWSDQWWCFSVSDHNAPLRLQIMTLVVNNLTDWCLNNKANILLTTFSNLLFYENVSCSIVVMLKLVHKGQIDIYPTLIRAKTWHHIGGKPLIEPVMTKTFTAI